MDLRTALPALFGAESAVTADFEWSLADFTRPPARRVLRITGPASVLADLQRCLDSADFSVRHAPKGGAGKYRGGQFLPTDEAGGGTGTDASARPSSEGPKAEAFAGFEDVMQSKTVQDYLAGKRPQDTLFSKTTGSMEDTFLSALADEVGFGATPKVVPNDRLAGLKKQGWWVCYRGVSEAKFAEQFRSGSLFAGGGIYGNGTYVAYHGLASSLPWGRRPENVARNYAGEGGSVMAIAFPPDARIIDVAGADKLQKEHRQRLNEQVMAGKLTYEQRDALEKIIEDRGRLCTLLGYDAIRIRGDGYLCILNRSKCVVGESDVAPGEATFASRRDEGQPMQDPEFSRRAAAVLHSDAFHLPGQDFASPEEYLAALEARRSRRQAFEQACARARSADDLPPEHRRTYDDGLSLLGEE